LRRTQETSTTQQQTSFSINPTQRSTMRTLADDKRDVSLRAQIMAGYRDDPVDKDVVLRIAGQANCFLQ